VRDLPAVKEARRAPSCENEIGVLSAPYCVGDGVAFRHLLQGVNARLYGIEIDANRAEQASSLGIDTLHGDAMDVRCPSETLWGLGNDKRQDAAGF
jgi:hypothetical protein